MTVQKRRGTNTESPSDASSTGPITSAPQHSKLHGYIVRTGLTALATGSGTSNAAGDTSHSDNGVEPGAVAGIAIGCLFAGIVLGIGCVWLLRHHTQRRSRDRGRKGLMHAPISPDKESSAVVETPDNTFKPDNFILQPTPDKEVNGMLRRLEVIIEQHVENYYHNQSVDMSVPALAQRLTNLGISRDSSGFEAETVAEWCLQPSRRRLALQHIVSHVLFKSIDCNSQAHRTLLPEHAIGFLKSICPINKNGTHSESKINDDTPMHSSPPGC
ncbi:uncharacterized protein FTOL_13645 [Fusarium torulosum]|uniref:Uncharacterized protein n=1 Tax=Fusarium torulosum TaxID=33205 RepID=A0AAE8MMU4_9HYPO|nr:uncharacterized protein FTOL_13645 [Fusarium torulosum]